jgi:hypothetical protein
MRNKQNHHFGGDIFQLVIENVRLRDVKKYLKRGRREDISMKREENAKLHIGKDNSRSYIALRKSNGRLDQTTNLVV